MIPLTVPGLGAEEIAAAERVLRSGMLVQGKEVAGFEAQLAQATQRVQAIAVSNGTAALELALRALDLGPGDEVLCPALTWPSPAHAVLSVGATPVLIDVDAHEWNATEEHFASALSSRTKAAIVIEQFGNPARHDAIREALGAIPIIVDAACSLGSRYHDLPCGSHGLLSCTSLHPRKVLTTGEGGVIFTDDAELAQRLRALRNHGQSEPGSFVFAAGNARMTELAAAIGQVQLAKLTDMCDARRRLFRAFAAALPGLSLQQAPALGEANHQTFGILVGPAGGGSAQRDQAIAALTARGVQAGKLTYALQTLPQFAAQAQAATKAKRSLSNTEDIAARGLCAPLFPSMSEAQHAQVVEALRLVINNEAYGD